MFCTLVSLVLLLLGYYLFLFIVTSLVQSVYRNKLPAHVINIQTVDSRKKSTGLFLVFRLRYCYLDMNDPHFLQRVTSIQAKGFVTCLLYEAEIIYFHYFIVL